MIIPLIVTEVLILVSASQLSVLDRFRCYNLTDIKSDKLYCIQNRTNVSYTIPDELYPAGFDYVSEGTKLGTYYYMYDNTSIHLFIITDETAKRIEAGEKRVTVYVRLIDDSATSSFVETEYADALGIDQNTLNNYVDSIILSEPGYPEVKIKLISYIKLLTIFLLGSTVIYFVLAIFYPILNYSYRNNGLFKNRIELYDVMNEELNAGYDKEGNVYTTENYQIVVMVSHIDIYKLEDE